MDDWRENLEEDRTAWIAQASDVTEYDNLLLSNNDKLSKLVEQVERVKSCQKQLDSNLELINIQQDDLEQLMGEIEKEIEEITLKRGGRVSSGTQSTIATLAGGSLQPVDIDRLMMYDLGNNINLQLNSMDRSISELIHKINTIHSHNTGTMIHSHLNSGVSEEDYETSRTNNNTRAIMQITEILNRHLDSLQWLDEQSTLLEHKLKDVYRSLRSD